MLNIGPSPIDPPQGIVLSLAWGLGGKVDYVFEGNIHSSADTLKWLRDNVHLFSDYDEMEQAAASVPDNGGVYLVPAFAGLGAPYWTHGVRALITGLERSSSRAHILRAAMESIAYQINDLLTEMRRDQRVPFAGLRVDGGATRNRFLMQLQADILGASLRVADIEDVSARGAAFAAGLATGVWRDRGQLAHSRRRARRLRSGAARRRPRPSARGVEVGCRADSRASGVARAPPASAGLAGESSRR